MKQNIRYTRMLAGAVLAMGVLTSCNTAQRLESAEYRETANILQTRGSAVTVNGRPFEYGFSVKADTARFYHPVPTDDISKNTFLLGEIQVSAKARNVPERDGHVNLDFMVRVPRKLQQYDWEILMLPNMDNGGQVTRLSPLLFSGKRFDWVNQRHRFYGLHYRDLRGAYRQEADDIYKRQFSRGNDLRADRMVDWYVDNLLKDGIDFRLDTIIRKADDIEYYYTNRQPVKNMTGKIKIWFDAQVTNLGYDRFAMAKSDTLYFNITSMLQFLDRTPRYITQTISRTVTDSLSANIQFHQGKSEVVKDLGNNRTELEKIQTRFEELVQSRDFHIDSIALTASCSPEGSWASNTVLAQNRARSIRDYFRNVFGKGETLNARSVPEDWAHARKAVAADGTIIDRDGILSIMDRNIDADAKERLIAATYPDDYRYMLKNIYPYLRAVDFQFYLSRKDMVKDTIHSSVMDTRYMDAIRMMDNRNYTGAKAILDQYMDWNTAICYMQMGLYRSAWDILNAMPEKSAACEYLLAVLAERMGDRQLAHTILLKACKMDGTLVHRAYLDPEMYRIVEYYDMHDEMKSLAAE